MIGLAWKLRTCTVPRDLYDLCIRMTLLRCSINQFIPIESAERRFRNVATLYTVLFVWQPRTLHHSPTIVGQTLSPASTVPRNYADSN